MNNHVERIAVVSARMLRRVFTVLVTLIMTSLVVSAQGTVRIEGVITDEVTGKPVGCKIDVTNSEGKKILNLTSNEKDGTYLMVLNEPGTMKITFRGHGVIRREATIEVPKTDRFKEVRQDFRVRALYQGTTLMSVRGFERNLPTLSSQGRSTLAELQNLLRENGEMRVEITVAPDEDQMQALRAASQAQYAKELAAWNAAKKKLKKGQAAPPEPTPPGDVDDPNTTLVQDRVAVLKEALKDVKNGDMRITYVTAPLPAGAVAAVASQPAPAATVTVKGKKGQKSPASSAPSETAVQPRSEHPTLVVMVGKVKKLFD